MNTITINLGFCNSLAPIRAGRTERAGRPAAGSFMKYENNLFIPLRASLQRDRPHQVPKTRLGCYPEEHFGHRFRHILANQE